MGVIPEYDDFCFMTIKEGYFFGEQDILFNNETHLHTFKAYTDVVLYVLNKQQFQNIFFLQFRPIGVSIASNSYIR